MVFSSLEFLFVFLPVTLLGYWISPRRVRNLVLLVASLIFYTWGAGAFVLGLLAIIAINYPLGLWVAPTGAGDDARRAKIGVTMAVIANMGLLAYYKYAAFVAGQLDGLLGMLDLAESHWVQITLPIGISFFTFQAMSYVIDVARGTRPPQRNVINAALYVALFPQLIAGPIVRYHQIAEQLTDRKTTVDGFATGAMRFCHGLVKKVVIADTVAVVADAAFGTPTGELTLAGAWIGVIAYALQIYFDFSGYADMALGLGKMFGFSFPENFRRPYSAVSVTDFWRRWHMTLSNWFRDYLYIPLGGSQSTAAKTYRNLWIVFIVTGMWHGAAWTFVVWGAYHGLLLIIERVIGQRPVGDQVNMVVLRRAGTLLAVLVGWVFFRAESLPHAFSYLGTMFSPGSLTLTGDVGQVTDGRVAITLALACLVALMPRNIVGGPIVAEQRGAGPAAWRVAVLVLGVPAAILLMAGGTFSPFLYFRF